MEPPDKVEPDAETKNAKQSEIKEKREKNTHERVKIMQDEIYSKEICQDTDDIDQTLDQERANECVHLLKLKEEENKSALNEDVHVGVKELHGQDSSEEESNEELKQTVGNVFLIKKTHERNETTIVGDIQVDVKEPQGREILDDKKIAMIKRGMGDIFLTRKRPPKIGHFRDNKRRIDLVLVMEEDLRPKVQAIKIDFLTNIVKTGLEIEYEPGVMKRHKHLIFIKVHATDRVLEDYAGLLGVKKYFKDKHLDFIKTENFAYLLFQFRHECEWIRLVRSQYIEPLGYSNLDRSYIVYMMLRHLRFGEPTSYYSLTRLLDQKIIIDAYALHDGPYFTIPQQDYKRFTARQILFYNWAGFEDVFTFQPINLVNEYFGPRIGFYFAFYEFYIKALFVPVVLGTAVFIYQSVMFESFRPTKQRPNLVGVNATRKRMFFRPRESDFPCGHYGQDIDGGWENFSLCPKCRNFTMCPFLKLDDICDSVYYKSFLDNHTAIYFSFIICIMVILFIRFWERAENYFIWMWELGHCPKLITTRSESEAKYITIPTRSKDTGVWITSNTPVYNALSRLVSHTMLWVCALGAAALTGGLLWFNIFLTKKYITNLETKKVYPEYIILSVVAIVGSAAAFVGERICWVISYYATLLENHRIQEKFDRSYILKVFSCSFAFTFPMLFYISLVKGSLYFTPIYNYSPELKIVLKNKTRATYKYDWLGDLFITNCGYYAGCWDELVLYYTLTVIFKVVATKLPKYICCLTTDYNQGFGRKRTKNKVPSWEREFMLDTITERTIVLKINDLIIQLALLALFGFTNSWTIVLAFIINLWDIRHDARVFLLACRRPLLLRYEGLGIWRTILHFICYAAVVTMSLMLAKSSSFPLAYTFETLENTTNVKRAGDQHIGLTVYLRLSSFKLNNFELVPAAKKSLGKYTKEKPLKCYFPGIFEVDDPKIKIEWPFEEINVTYPGSIVYNRFNYKQKVVRASFFLAYNYGVIAAFLLLHYYFPGRDQKTKEVVYKERNLLRVHLHNEAGGKKHYLDD